jgi:hypothetical protein
LIGAGAEGTGVFDFCGLTVAVGVAGRSSFVVPGEQLAARKSGSHGPDSGMAAWTVGERISNVAVANIRMVV